MRQIVALTRYGARKRMYNLNDVSVRQKFALLLRLQIKYDQFAAVICKRNANALWLNAVVDVRLRRRHEMIFFIFRKMLKLATSKFETA